MVRGHLPEPAIPRPSIFNLLRSLGDRSLGALRLVGDRSLDALRLVGAAAPEPLDLRIAGRVLLHSGLVGLVAGGLGALFFAALEVGQRLLVEGLAGLELLRAGGERVVPSPTEPTFHWWILLLLPALGGLASGVLTSWLAPEAAGGGGDAAIEAYHHGGLVRRRVVPVKGLAAILALSTGGSGGREGPTMQIGAAVGSAVARLLPTTRAERRILLIAGIAAGLAAVFRTPLGAALLAVELAYRDDFEAEALIPSVFASVVAYSVVIAVFGETRVFTDLPRFPFRPTHLPLYAAVAVAVSVSGVLFVRLLRAVQRVSSRLRLPVWARPALGGLLMGTVGVALLLWIQHAHGEAARGFGVFGGGYGVLQRAMTGAGFLPSGWGLVGLLLLVAALKMVASALTIGTGAAAGDFAPSLVIGGLVGAAFGEAAQLLSGDPSLHPAAFALVGMGTFYGGLAHAPLAALVLVSELAGSYDLLVPMMLAIGIAYVALRRHSLYPAQRASRVAPGGDGPRATPLIGPIPSVDKLLVPPEVGPVEAHLPLAVLGEAMERTHRQRVVLVRGATGYIGLVDLQLVAEVPEAERSWMKVNDAMVPMVSLPPSASWTRLAEELDRCSVSQLPILDASGEVLGWVGDRELRIGLRAGAAGVSDRAPASG
jgi:CIC family chloride channel protein